MSKTYERIKRDVERTIALADAEQAEVIHEDPKAITLRLTPRLLHFVDTMANTLGVSRQTFLTDVIYDGCEDSLDAWADAHGPSCSVQSKESFLTELQTTYTGDRK